MKNFILTTFFFLSLSVVYAQKVYVDVGKSISKFDYKTSTGETLDNLTSGNGNRICIGARLPLFQTEFHLRIDALYNEYKAQGSNPVLGNFYSWDFMNAGANIGFDFEFLKPKAVFGVQQGFSFLVKALFSSEFVLSGTQNINNDINTLKGAPEFDLPFLFARGGVDVNYYFDPAHIIFISYSVGKSFLVGDYTNQEQLKLFSHSISLGLSINLAPDKKPFK